MKYKIGDKVRIKSLDWYNENKTSEGCLVCGESHINPEMINMLGKIVTISSIEGNHYRIKEYAWNWTDEMIEGLVEEDIIDIDEFQDDDEVIDIIDDYIYRLKGNGCQIDLPDGYQFTDENGNIINATKIVLEKKKKEVTYPKTYEECCKIIYSDPEFYVDTHLYSDTLGALYKLLICRDAYWKIAGEEMGLDGPWEPDWNNEEQDKYGFHNEVKYTIINSAIFVFPTAEMRDAFRENFDQDIEIYKELL